MKKRNLVLTIMFSVAIALPLATVPFLDSTYETVDVDENRTLAAFPTTFTDDFGNRLSAYINDHFPFRSDIVKSFRELKKQFAKVYKDFISSFIPKPGYTDSSNSTAADSSTPTQNPTESTPTIEESVTTEGDYMGDLETFDPIEDDYGLPYTQIGDVIFGRNDYLFYSSEEEIYDYSRTNIPTLSELQAYAARIGRVADYFTSQGKQVKFMICPNKSTAYSEYMPSSINRMNVPKNKAETVVDYFNSNVSNLSSIYPLNYINDIKPYRSTYYKSDTHWNSLGGFVGFRGFMEQEFNIHYPIPFSVRTNTGPGDLARMAGVDYQDDFNYLVGFKNNVSSTVNITPTENNTNLYEYSCSKGLFDNALFIHDSFAYGMMDFFGKEFKHSTFANFNSNFTSIFDTPAYQNADYIVIECVERSLHRLFLDNDQGILKQIENHFNL